MKKLKALIIGIHPDLGQALPLLLWRAGFEIEAITSGSFVNYGTLISRHAHFKTVAELLRQLAVIDLSVYDLIVPFDDTLLRDIVNSDLSLTKKLKLLPVVSAKNFKHLGSKIELSKILAQAQILTPDFLEACGRAQVLEAAQKLQFPLMVKVDFSGGGGGVFECQNQADIEAIAEAHLALPTLVQKKISGRELDLSAFYQNGNLVHFSFSAPEKVVSKFGPSSLRTYEQLGSCCDQKLFSAMQNLGTALGADGFVNISAMLSEGQIYFFEADMRPNVWVDFTRLVGDDLAVRIKNYFATKAVLQFPLALNADFAHKILVPHFLRISLREVWCNHHKVWQTMSGQDFLRILKVSAALPHKAVIFLLKKMEPRSHRRRWVKTKTRAALQFLWPAV